MIKYTKKNNTPIKFCKIDKPIVMAHAWGENGSPQLQSHNNGCWLRINGDGVGTHLVAHNSTTNTPVGWFQVDNNDPFAFKKQDVFAQLFLSGTRSIKTLDGEMTYSGEGYVVYNMTSDGKPDLNDGWFVKKDTFEDFYTLLTNLDYEL